MIYVYAVTEGGVGSARGAPGIAGAPLRAVSSVGLAAVYSDDPPPGLRPTAEALWRHEHVLEELMRHGAVLPLRFGSTLAGEAELRELLAAREDEFSAALRAVRGRVEMGVRASVATPAEPTAGSGRAYLAAKLERRRAAARIGEKLDSELAPLASSSTYRLLGDPQPTFAGSYLVERDAVERFRGAFEAARASHPDLALACTGPWPPFSFTDAKAAA